MDKRTRSRTPIEVAAERLRQLVLAREDESLIGSEDEMTAILGCSRSTVRQVARLLEREGLLRVKRGLNGGYFGTRPKAETIEATVSAYLETLPMQPSEITVLASALWVEAMRMAAVRRSPEAEAAVKGLRKRLKALSDTAPFDVVRTLELDTQATVFALANCPYVKLIFDINMAFSRRRFSEPITDNSSAEHLTFVRRWRLAKLLELDAIELGDRELAVNAARSSRKVWHDRLKLRFANLDAGAGLGK